MKKRIKETILYVIFGVLTTAINISSYYILKEYFNIYFIISNCIAWVIAVLFSYFTNRSYVFNSNNNKTSQIIREFISFIFCRLLTGVIDAIIMWLGVEVFKIDDMYVKVLANAIVIILNFILSKTVIFRKRI